MHTREDDMKILEQIIALAEEGLNEEPAVETKDPEVWTDEYISMLVSGTPDLHIRNPSQFRKMAPYADESRPPFTVTNWMTTAWGGKDARPMKAVEVDGKMYRPMVPSIEPDWYAVCKRGVLDVTEKQWLVPVGAPLNPRRKQMLENAKAYMGGLRQSLDTWPDDLRAAYEL